MSTICCRALHGANQRHSEPEHSTTYVLHPVGKVHSGFTAADSDHGVSQGQEAQAWVSWVLWVRVKSKVSARTVISSGGPGHPPSLSGLLAAFTPSWDVH